MSSRVRGLLERILSRRREIAGEGIPDLELLRRFTQNRDEAAFELLVWRHGSMVLGLCQRTIRDTQLAEDAFQAVFLILARKANSVRENIGGWLFKVARRVATRALQKKSTVQPVMERAETIPDSAERDEIFALLDAEIAYLPERLRRPIVLCYLGGYSTEDAARELGCPRGTVLSRLATARKRLAERLMRRGVTLPASLAIVAITGELVSAATATARAYCSGFFTQTVATQLAEGVMQAMSRTAILTVTSGLVFAVVLAGGVGWVAASGGPDAKEAPAAIPTPLPPVPVATKVPPDDKERSRIVKLHEQSAKLEERIVRLQKRIDDAVAEAAPPIGLETLQAQLVTVERTIFDIENALKSRQAELDRFTNAQKEAAEGKVGEHIVKDRLDRLPAVQKAEEQLKKIQEVIATLQKTLPADHVLTKAAEKAFAEETTKRDAVRKDMIKEAEKVALADLKLIVDQRLKDTKIIIKDYQEQSGQLQTGRRKLLGQIADLKQHNMRWTQLQEEMKVLRQIQLDLFRQQMLAELGVDAIPTARDDSRTDAELKDLRKQVEALQAEVEKLRGQKKK